MNDPAATHDRDRLDEHADAIVGRRELIAAGGGVGATLLAGCTSESSPAADGDGETDDSTDDGTDATGVNFRLLISDMPADIGDFDSLDVSFDDARIFDGGSEDDDETGEEDDDGTEEEVDDETGEEDDEEEPGGVDRKRGFYILDLDGATVDLTQVVDEKAMNVFEGELSPGRYEKIELRVEDIEGIVDGEAVEVTVPSEKLQLTNPFEVREDEPVEFVFDINVVKRGQQASYNLKPVISKSGINGEDVDVEEVADERDEQDSPDESGDETAADDGTDE